VGPIVKEKDKKQARNKTIAREKGSKLQEVKGSKGLKRH